MKSCIQNATNRAIVGGKSFFLLYLKTQNMDEAYKFVPKKDWDNFKEIHGEKVVNYVRSILGDEVDENHFSIIYERLTRIKRSPSKKINSGRHLCRFLKKINWIK